MNLSRRSLLSAFTVTSAAHWLRGQQQPPPAQGASAGSRPPGQHATPAPGASLRAGARPAAAHVFGGSEGGEHLRHRARQEGTDRQGSEQRRLRAGRRGARPQVIRYFARETDLPLTLGLLVDTSGSQRNVIGDERERQPALLRPGAARGPRPGVPDSFRQGSGAAAGFDALAGEAGESAGRVAGEPNRSCSASAEADIRPTMAAVPEAASATAVRICMTP
jgi:hypothetical protein